MCRVLHIHKQIAVDTLFFNIIMVFFNISKQPLIPHFLYSTHSPRSDQHNFMIPAPNEPLRKMEMYSPQFYATCGVGGMLSCGLTQLAYTPLNLLNSKMRMDPLKYPNMSSSFMSLLLKEQGVRGLFKGWSPTLVGYGAQGACRFGFYKFFKKYYSEVAGPYYGIKYSALIYTAAASSAEVIACIALCPMEAVKVRVQTQPGYARGLVDGLPKFVKSQGVLGLYKGLVPLWRHQIPYTMINLPYCEIRKVVFFEGNIGKPKNECSIPLQIGGSFESGFEAGAFSAFILNSRAILLSHFAAWKALKAAEKVGYWDFRKLRIWPLHQRIVMIGILSGIQWGIYDSIKMFCGIEWGIYDSYKMIYGL